MRRFLKPFWAIKMKIEISNRVLTLWLILLALSICTFFVYSKKEPKKEAAPMETPKKEEPKKEEPKKLKKPGAK